MIARGRRRSFQRRVLDWYAAHGRDLPWRRTRDPYAILVSEILSHQTQIARVLPVYERLLGRYPTVTALARAPLAEVKAITDPLDELRSLPGIGRYTAGAVMSFAHHRDAPVLDTNVARLLRRYFGVVATRRARTQELWSLATAVIPKGKGYLINQALMDLGAMICRARAPRCDACPLRRSCDFGRKTKLGRGPAWPRRPRVRSRPAACPHRW